MAFPIRCLTCSRVLDQYEYYLELTAKIDNPLVVYQKMGLKHDCCKKMYSTHPHQLWDDIIQYGRSINEYSEARITTRFGPSVEFLKQNKLKVMVSRRGTINEENTLVVKDSDGVVYESIDPLQFRNN